MVAANLLDELVLGHGLGRVVHMEALRLERTDSLLANVLEQQQPEVLVVYGVEDLGLADRETNSHRVLSTGAFLEGRGGGGGDRDDARAIGLLGDGDGGAHGVVFKGGELEQCTAAVDRQVDRFPMMVMTPEGLKGVK